MQDINNHLDELFQKAVSHYTLMESENRWDELTSRLPAADSHTSNLMTGADYKYTHKTFRHAVWILVFAILLPFLIDNHTNPQALKINSPETRKTNSALLSRLKGGSSKINPAYSFQMAEKGGSSKINPAYSFQMAEKGTESSASFAGKIAGSIPETPGSDDHPVPNGSFTEITVDGIRSFSESPVVSDMVSINPASSAFMPLQQSLTNTALQNLHSVRRRGLYLGILFGPMSSQVKNQGHQKMGFDAGLTIGYKISNRIAIESGLLFTKQYYYVGGKYYNEVTGNDQVQSMEGNRTAIEIPLKLNYTVLKTKTGNLFISTGVSSFVGVRENIVLQVDSHVPPPPQRIDYGKSSYLPSYWDFSLGYEHRIGKIANIRIEPYLQIPLKSGVENAANQNATGGALPVYNAGLHLEITRFIR